MLTIFDDLLITTIMESLYKFAYDKAFLGALILLIAINVIAVFLEDSFFMKSVMPLFIPVFLIFFFMKRNTLGIVFISFLLFSFLGDITTMFLYEEHIIEISSILYAASYICLLVMVVPKLKLIKPNLVITAYLLIVLSITLYFLFVIYGLLQAVVPNSNEVLLFGVKSLVLIILGFVSFTVYLSTQSKQSALFLTSIIFFGLSSILNYVNLYYLYDWSFELLHKLLYAIALFVMFSYVMDLGLTRTPKQFRLNQNNRYSSDAVLS
ncbi:hypothetical protein [Mariniflexile sp.]|uniref:hypothetical protein n=1 Tax=Mariniflexile sp. TaxID=1979402 RepID=UPI003567989E